MDWFEGFADQRYPVGDITLRCRRGGTRGAPALLMLHGFPQTSAMWHRVARKLAPHFDLVMPDLRGYGESDKPAGTLDHGNYSKRTMAKDVHRLMRSLGHVKYHVVGHDRGGRVAHRLAMDEPEAVLSLAVLDIVPTKDMYDNADMRFASAYYHWFFLIQPAPHPEEMIGADPEHYARWKLGGWGSQGRKFHEPEATAEYLRCFNSPDAIHAVCEDYRASASIDMEHDQVSRQDEQFVNCDLLVLWGTRGVINALFDPMKLWRAQCTGHVTGHALAAGHYLAEELPDEVSQHLLAFFQRPVA
jgi:haloacetate dehalogenase